MRFTIYQESRIGRRDDNQDRVAYCYSRDALVMVLADGMGSSSAGELAAEIAARHVVRSFQREARPALADPLRFLARALTGAHHAILDEVGTHALDEAPSTTVIACVIQHGVAQWAHAGDSRLYVLRDGSIHRRTRDHSWVQKMVDEGKLSASEAERHPGRNRIYSCIGGPQSPHIDYSSALALCAGDVILLCSDGLWDPLGDERILARLTSGSALAATVETLLDDAERLAREQADNLSVIALRWNDAGDATTSAAIFTRTMRPDDFASVRTHSPPSAPGTADGEV